LTPEEAQAQMMTLERAVAAGKITKQICRAMFSLPS
jgi:hypothetical protein